MERPLPPRQALLESQRDGRVFQWLSCPDDKRFLSLSDLYVAVKARADRATARTVESRKVQVVASPVPDAPALEGSELAWQLPSARYQRRL